ncbi:TRAP transporter substrate-binding protein [Polycladidibacter hongkongensis]|uniref:TRAP transporter substrate-binding protein n=1 Tax=Polycladidibacter hongkongensis TaxID=1647556 RepID=UPI0008378CD3|nr:TRAP transporter substrate-binding protein [Pseudovibrio hongkongensis]
MKFSKIAVALLGMTLATSSFATTLRLADTMPEGVPNAEGVKFFAERVNELTDGEVTVQVFSNGILGSERENVEQVKKGVLDMARVASSTLDSFTNSVKPVTLPYVFSSSQHLIDAMNGEAGKLIFEGMEKDGITAVNFFVIGPRSFYTKDKPINTPDDLKGMKIRVMNSQMAIKTMNLLGASPTPLPMGDVYTALSQGVVDGAENAVQALIEHRHGEVVNYYSWDEHFNYPEFIIMGEATKAKLTAEQLKAIKQAGKEATDYEIGLAMNVVEKSVKEATERQGIKFNEADKAAFQAKVKPIYDELIAEQPDAQKVLDAIAAAKK